MTLCHKARRQPLSLRAEKERDGQRQLDRGEWVTAVRDERDLPLRESVPVAERNSEDRSGRCPQRTRASRIRALRRERHARAERVGRAQQRADVPRIRDLPEREHDLTRTDGQVGASVDADEPWDVPEGRHLREELGHDVLAGHEQIDRLDARPCSRLDEILALDREEPRLLTMLPRREKLPDEPELLVLTRFDQAA